MFGPNKDFQTFTQFIFSGLKGQTKISRKGLHFYSSKVTLVFSCTDKSFLDYFLAQLFEQKEIIIGSLQLTPDSFEQEEEILIAEEAKFLCISPIVPLQAGFNDERSKKFINPEVDEFSDLLYEATLSRMQASGKYTPEQLTSFYKFQIVPDSDYLHRIQESSKKFARIYPVYDNDVKFEVRGYTFPFTLYAAPEVQRFVYEFGLGYFCHKGFGMLDISHNDSIRKNTHQELVFA